MTVGITCMLIVKLPTATADCGIDTVLPPPIVPLTSIFFPPPTCMPELVELTPGKLTAGVMRMNFGPPGKPTSALKPDNATTPRSPSS